MRYDATLMQIASTSTHSTARIFLLIFLIGLIGLVSCSDKDDTPTSPDSTGPSSLFVRVRDNSNDVVANAMVFTKPESQRDMTDELGSVMFQDVEPGVYTVWATHSNIGSGNAAVSIEAGHLSEVDISLESGIFLQPSVNILSPDWGNSYSYIDTVIITALVSDINEEAPDLTLLWSSSLDGELPTEPADEDGEVVLAIDSLSWGEHIIRLQAENDEGFVAFDSVKVIVAALAPVVEILSPEDGQGFTPGEEIVFSAHVSDRETPVIALEYEFKSDQSGIFGSGNPDATGEIMLTTTDLSPAEHIVTLSVTDSDTMTTEVTVTIINLIPGPVDQIDAITENSAVTITWSATFDPDFSRYEIYRSVIQDQPGEKIGETLTIDATTYVDTEAPMVQVAYYHVRVYNTHGYFRESDVVEVNNPGGLVLMNEPSGMLIHPTETWIYLDYGGTIFRVDFSAMEILNTGSVASFYGWKDMGDCGQGPEIYCPGSDGWIRILDSVNFSVITSINTGLATKCAIPGPDGIVCASVMPSPWWEQPLRSYDRATGEYIDGNGDFDGCRLRLLPSGFEIIEITTGVSPTDMDYYRLDATGHFLEHADDSQHGGPPLSANLFYASPNGEFVITSSSAAMYSANSSMSYLGQLPRGSRSFTDYAFSYDGNTIYAAVSGEQLILRYEYPSMQQTAEIATRTKPLFIERQGDQLVIVGAIAEDYGMAEAAIEIILLEP